MKELEAKKAELETAIVKEKIAKVPLSRDKVVFWISRFKALPVRFSQGEKRLRGSDAEDSQYQKSLVDIFVNSMFLYEDKLVIGFNWKGGTKMVSLAGLEAVAEGESGDNENGSALASVGGDSGAEIGKADRTAETRASRGLFMGRFAP